MENLSRSEFLKQNPKARAWAALDKATNQQLKTTPGAIKLKKGSFKNKKAIILGAGIAGLTTAYELLANDSGMEVTVLEAQSRTGGRCLSLRAGDTLTEDEDSKLFGSKPKKETQVVRFKQPIGDSEPYFNAGPGRIPSAHKRVLSYLKQFGVEVEVYVMNSEANLVQKQGGPFKSKPVPYRRINHDTRGWLAQMVYENAATLLKSHVKNAKRDQKKRVDQLKELMISFGRLTENGKYIPDEGDDGLENARSRNGFEVLPGVDAGEIAEAISLDNLLALEFWKPFNFYQPVDFLWQPTLFQPVGGMDRVQHAFAQQVASRGGMIHLNSPVKLIEWDSKTKEFIVHVSQVGTNKCKEYRADYCFCNIAMPFLKRILSKDLQSSKSNKGFEKRFKEGLKTVYRSQFEPKPNKQGGYVARFLANTTKVGWQCDRKFWQGSPISSRMDSGSKEHVMGVPSSEVGVVPIFGGISWTDHEILQIWYPSNAFHDEKGVLTGAYNFQSTAFKWGKLSTSERLKRARTGAERFSKKFGQALDDGVAIAWQNIPHIKGGWAQWHVVDEVTKGNAVVHFNQLVQGTGVYGSGGRLSKPVFFIIGDQVSSLPGWQEGAIASALNAISRICRPDLKIPHLYALPDTRIMVEGI